MIRRQASNPSTTCRCSIQSSGSGLRWNQIRRMQRGCWPARMAWMMGGSSCQRESAAIALDSPVVAGQPMDSLSPDTQLDPNLAREVVAFLDLRCDDLILYRLIGTTGSSWADGDERPNLILSRSACHHFHDDCGAPAWELAADNQFSEDPGQLPPRPQPSGVLGPHRSAPGGSGTATPARSPRGNGE